MDWKNLCAGEDPSLAKVYHLDQASFYPVLALEVRPQDLVLDMCAAPGGKSLLILERSLVPEHLTFNEMSNGRRQRLRRVFKDYVPQGIFGKLRLTGHNASKWCLYEKQVYDKILLDAPCSGERHLLHKDTELAKWSQARSKNLSVRQYALLCSAGLVAKPGGRIVYSTCSISAIENDNVIEKFLKKKGGNVVRKTWELGEATEYGWQILPDVCDGRGPIYFAIIE